MTSGRGLVVRASAFQADDVSSILTVRSKFAGMVYGLCLGPPDRRNVFESRCPLQVSGSEEGSRAAVT